MLFIALCGFIVGLLVGSLHLVTLALLAACFLLASICLIVYRFERGHLVHILFAAVFLFAVASGLGRMYVSDLYRPSQLNAFVGKHIVARGIVWDEPDVREHNVKLTVKLTDVTFASTTKKVNETVLVTVPLYPEFLYGDKLSLSLVLGEPKPIDSDGRVFDYSGYLRARGVWFISTFTSVRFVSAGHGSLIKTWLFSLKAAFTHALDRAISTPESSLMAGLLLGTKQSLGTKLLNEFSRAGVSHVVVLSGYNIAIVAESIMVLLVFLPGSFAFGIGCASIILFTMLAGGGASAWRAAIMVLVALFATRSNREYTASRAFGIAVALMLVLNPLLLVFDPSFQLSVLATLGLIFVSPFVAPYLTWVTEKYGMREIVSSTVATEIIVLPFLIYTTGILSLVALPVNILILGFIPLTMLLGFLTGAVGLISFYLSFIPALFAYMFLWYDLTIVHAGATLPFGSVTLPGFSPLILIFIYMLIFFGLYLLHKRKP